MHTVAVPSMSFTWFSILYQPPYATDNTMLVYSTWFVYISSSFFRFTICFLDIVTIIVRFLFTILVKNNEPRLFKHLVKHSMYGFYINRFYNMRIHPCFKRLLFIFFKCICCHGNDWNIGFLVILQSTKENSCYILC